MKNNQYILLHSCHLPENPITVSSGSVLHSIVIFFMKKRTAQILKSMNLSGGEFGRRQKKNQ